MKCRPCLQGTHLLFEEDRCVNNIDFYVVRDALYQRCAKVPWDDGGRGSNAERVGECFAVEATFELVVGD